MVEQQTAEYFQEAWLARMPETKPVTSDGDADCCSSSCGLGSTVSIAMVRNIWHGSLDAWRHNTQCHARLLLLYRRHGDVTSLPATKNSTWECH